MRSEIPRFIPSSPSGAILAKFQLKGSAVPPGAEEAFGYLCMNLPEMAVEALREVPVSPSDDGGVEALRLLAHEHNGMPATDLADRAAASLTHFPGNRLLLEMSILYHCLAERYSEVLQLEERYRDSGVLVGSELHTIACAAARTGDYRRALDLVVNAAVEHGTPGEIFTDCQLSPLWHHYAATTPDAEEAALLTEKGLGLALAAAEDSRVPCSVCEYTVRRVLPERFRPWMQRNLSAHYEVVPHAPQEIIHGFCQWREEVRRKNIRLVRRAIRRGREVRAELEAMKKRSGNHPETDFRTSE